MGDAVALAELVQQRGPFDAERCLQRSGRVVDPGMDDAAVVGAGLHAGARVTFHDADARSAGGDLGGTRQPCHTGANDQDVDAFRHVSVLVAGPV